MTKERLLLIDDDRRMAQANHQAQPQGRPRRRIARFRPCSDQRRPSRCPIHRTLPRLRLAWFQSAVLKMHGGTWDACGADGRECSARRDDG